MKLSVLFKKSPLTVCLALAVLFSATSFAQILPELVFKNPVLENGVAGEDGAKYRFSNVATNLDAVLEIKGRSASNVVIGSIDTTYIGWDKALQPVVGIAGTIAPYQTWWAKFRISFYDAGTTHKRKITKFFVTGLDIDGDGADLQEWVEMNKMSSISFSEINHLTDNLLSIIEDLLDFDDNGEDHRIMGPIANYANIDTAATSVMATYQYDKKDYIEFSLGGQTNASGTSGGAGMRLNSLWFKQFNLNPILPVKLTDFTAQYNKPDVKLTWKSSEETNFDHYLVERSYDGKNFSSIASVAGAGVEKGSGVYTYTDKNASTKGELVYYRLQMVDIDGKHAYSAVRIIRTGVEKQTMSISAFPNPVQNDLRITIPASWQGKAVQLEIYDAGGRSVKRLQSENSNQIETITVSDLGRGLYIVKAACGTEAAMQKIIKN